MAGGTLVPESVAPASAGPRSSRRQYGGIVGESNRAGNVAAQVFLFLAAVVWIVPVLWAVYLSFRPLEETNKYGYVSWPRSLTSDQIPSSRRSSCTIFCPNTTSAPYWRPCCTCAVTRSFARTLGKPGTS